MSDSRIDLRASSWHWRGGTYGGVSSFGRTRRAVERRRNYRLTVSLIWCAWIAIAVATFMPVDFGASGVAVPILVVFSFGILVYLAQRAATTGNNKYLMALILISAQYAYFCLPYFDPGKFSSARFMGIIYNPSHTLYILGYSIVFMLLFVVGFLACPIHARSLLTDSQWNHLNNFVFPKRTVQILLIMVGSMLFLNFRLDSFIPSAIAFAGLLLTATFPLCVVALSCSETSELTRMFVFGVLYPTYYLIRIADGLIAEWFLANLIIFIGYVLLGKRPPLALVVVAAILTVPLLRAKETYRNDFVATGRVYHMTRLEAGLDYLADGLDTKSTDASVSLRSSRDMAGPIAFSRVLDYLESGNATYQWGATFADLPLSIIPRAVAPWKPKKDEGQWFGHTYGILAPGDKHTSVNLSPIVESYINFGDYGVFLAVLLGGICAWLYDLFGGGKSTVSMFFIIAIFSSLANTELSISLGYGQVLQMSAVAWVLLKLRRRYSGMPSWRVLANSSMKPKT